MELSEAVDLAGLAILADFLMVVSEFSVGNSCFFLEEPR